MSTTPGAMFQPAQIGSGPPGLAGSVYPLSSPSFLSSQNSVFNSTLGNNNLELLELLRTLPNYPLGNWLQTNPNSADFNAAIKVILQNPVFTPMTPGVPQETCNTPIVSNPSPPEVVTPIQQPLSQQSLKQGDSPPHSLPETIKKEKIEPIEPINGKKPRKPKAKVTLIPGMPFIQRIRRRKRNGSIPEEDEPPTPQKVSPPGCKQPLPPSPEEGLTVDSGPRVIEIETSRPPPDRVPPAMLDVNHMNRLGLQQQWSVLSHFYSKQQMNTPDDPVIHSPPSLRLNQGPATNAFQQQMPRSVQQRPGNSLLMENTAGTLPATPGTQASTEDPNKLRRAKNCRVCNDHATGYNFNVISCESCKAFFRRNALRPKTDFKCPYSDDCEITAVSRRFCQKCRLKKCFEVGMKKEWILNEEQLKRRKNSRLNNLKGAGNSGPSSVRSPATLAGSPYSPQQSQINAAVARNVAIVDSVTNSVRNEAIKLGKLRTSTDSLVSPPSVTSSTGQQILSPMNCVVSPISQSHQMSPRLSAEALNQMKPIPLSEIVTAIQRQTTPNTVALPAPSCVQVVKVVAYSNRLLNPAICQLLQCGEIIRISLPLADYANLLRAFPNKRLNELPNGDIPLPDEAYDPLRDVISEHVQKALQTATVAAVQRPNSKSEFHSSRFSNDYTPQVRTTSLLPNGAKYDDVTHYKMGPPPHISMDALSPETRQRHEFINSTIASALAHPHEGLEDSGHNNQNPAPLIPMDSRVTDLLQLNQLQKNESPKKPLQLNAIELKELDAVRNAFTCMEEPLQDPEAARNLMKKEHTPADILNIMDVTIRRIVRTAKKLSHFQEISNDGKLQLLRSSMIDMLTIREVSLLDEKMEAWKTQILGDGQQASISCNIFNQLCNAEQRTKFMEFCKTISPTLRSNRVALMLVALVILFDNSRARNLCDSDQEIVRRYHELYYHLLQRYVESVYEEAAPEMIKTIPLALRRLAKITEGSAVLFMDKVDSKNVAKLPSEFFKLESGRPKSDPQIKNEFEDSNP